MFNRTRILSTFRYISSPSIRLRRLGEEKLHANTRGEARQMKEREMREKLRSGSETCRRSLLSPRLRWKTFFSHRANTEIVNRGSSTELTTRDSSQMVFLNVRNCRLRNCPITQRSDCQQHFLFDLRRHLHNHRCSMKFGPRYRFLRYLKFVLCRLVIEFFFKPNIYIVQYILKITA